MDDGVVTVSSFPQEACVVLQQPPNVSQKTSLVSLTPYYEIFYIRWKMPAEHLKVICNTTQLLKLRTGHKNFHICPFIHSCRTMSFRGNCHDPFLFEVCLQWSTFLSAMVNFLFF